MSIIVKRIDPYKTVRRYSKEKNLTSSQKEILLYLCNYLSVLVHNRITNKWYIKYMNETGKIISSQENVHLLSKDAEVIINLDIIKSNCSEKEFKVGVALGAWPNMRCYKLDRKKLLEV